MPLQLSIRSDSHGSVRLAQSQPLNAMHGVYTVTLIQRHRELPSYSLLKSSQVTHFQRLQRYTTGVRLLGAGNASRQLHKQLPQYLSLREVRSRRRATESTAHHWHSIEVPHHGSRGEHQREPPAAGTTAIYKCKHLLRLTLLADNTALRAPHRPVTTSNSSASSAILERQL